MWKDVDPSRPGCTWAMVVPGGMIVRWKSSPDAVAMVFVPDPPPGRWQTTETNLQYWIDERAASR